MFNSPSATTKTEKTFIPVILTLVDGESLKGAISIPKSSCLGDLLNSSDKFVLFKTNTGEPVYLAHTTIAAVQSNQKPAARQLDASLKQFQETDPYHILKVKPGVDKIRLREAYHELVKHYHPDQFVGIDLPAEVHAYLEAMVTRLNAAYQEVVEELERLEHLKQLTATAQKKPDSGTIRFFGQ